MNEEKKYNEFVAEYAKKVEKDIRLRKIGNVVLVLFFLFVIWSFFDLIGDIKTLIRLRDQKADEIFQRFSNEKEYNRQQIDSIRRLNDSVKINCWRCKHKRYGY